MLNQTTFAPHPPRLLSLDAFRGFTMFWLMGGKPFIVALAALGGPAAAFIDYQLSHSDWAGLRYYDLIWPCFMLMVGMSVPLSFARRSSSEAPGRRLRRVWVRGVVLFLLGSLRESLAENSPVWIELSSALQPIALAYVVAAHLALHSLRLQIGVAAGILAAHALVLALVPAPGLPAGSYAVNQNLVTAVDNMLIGRSHPEGWGTALTALPPISTTILGLVLGQVLLSVKSPRDKMKLLGFVGLGCMAVGLALSPVIPVIMKLWTTSYGLISAGWACVLFLLFYWLIDVRQHKGWVYPLVVIGTNAIAAYLGPSIVPVRRIAGIFTKPVALQIGALGPLFSAAVVLLINWSILHWMYRRKIFLKA